MVKTQYLFAAFAAAGCLLVPASEASAQSLGGVIGAVRREVSRPQAPPRPAPARDSTEGRSVAPTSAVEARETASASGIAPWPTNAGARNVTRPRDLEFSPELQAQKQAFLEFSRVSCSACEGGRTYDAWARQILEILGNHEWEARVGALSIGESIEWSGAANDGVLTVVGETPVSGFPCKQVHWQLTRQDDPEMVMERPGLFCFGKVDRYVTTEYWIEAF